MFLNRYKQLFIQSINVDNNYNNRNHSLSIVSKFFLNKIEFKDSSRSIDFSIANDEFNTNIINIKEKDLININNNNKNNKNDINKNDYNNNDNNNNKNDTNINININDNIYNDSENEFSLEVQYKKNEININREDLDIKEKEKENETEKEKDNERDIKNLNSNLNQIENSLGSNTIKSTIQNQNQNQGKTKFQLQEIKEEKKKIEENKENILDKISYIVLDLGRDTEKRKIPFYLFPEILELLIINYDNEKEGLIDEKILKISEECNETLHSIIDLYNDNNYSNIKLFVHILKKYFNTKNDEILDNVLTWISKLFNKFQERMFIDIDDFINKFTDLLNRENEIIFNLVLNILFEIAKYKDDYIEIIIRQILDKLSKNINLLENRGKKIIKNFCNIIDIDRVFLSFAEELKNIKVIILFFYVYYLLFLYFFFAFICFFILRMRILKEK
jgi:hypothetical protein